MSESINPSPQQIHNAEHMWAQASNQLDDALQKIVHDVPGLKRYTGLSDASIVFDYICSMMIKAHPHLPALNFGEILGAAALTRLAQMLRGETYDMEQFERELNQDGQ